MKPFLKWAGGKSQIIDDVIELFPETINNYHEIFLGGGSVLLKFLEYVNDGKIELFGKVVAYDINMVLIASFRNVRDSPDKVYKFVKKITDKYNSIEDIQIIRKPTTLKEAKTSRESYYYWIRINFNKLSNKEKTSIIGTAYFIFLNKTCFRGLYREGPNGFNVPFGHYENPQIINKDHILKISELIKHVKFQCLTFEESLKKVHKDDFIYLDPPYFPIKKDSFVNYTSKGFNLESHDLLFSMCLNYKFLMSNSNAEYVIKKFEETCNIKFINCKRNINSKNPNSKVKEILISNID